MGFTEALRDRLEVSPGLKLPGRRSARHLRNVESPVSSAGKILNVEYTLEGTLRRNRPSKRINSPPGTASCSGAH